MSQHDDVSASVIAVVGLIGGATVLAIIVLLLVVFSHFAAGEAYRKDVGVPYPEQRRLAEIQRNQLADYRMLNAEKQVVAVPIERAKQLVLQQLKASDGARPPVEDGRAEKE